MRHAGLGPSLRTAYLSLLEQQFGLRLAPRQVDLMDELVADMVAASSYPGASELYDAFAAGWLPELLEGLATSLTVGETHFYRVTPQIDALRQTILPELIAGHSTDRRLRLWSAGCSTGEEPYTLAMLVHEQLSGAMDWDVQILATDLNQASLKVARAGIYSEWSFRDTPLEVRTRHFSPVANTWRIQDPVRSMVRFAQLNLVEDAFSFALDTDRLDLILCRNVTIYFGPQTSQRLYQRFAAVLQPGGWLLLGPSDPVPAAGSGLKMLELDGALVWRRTPLGQAAAIAPATPRVHTDKWRPSTGIVVPASGAVAKPVTRKMRPPPPTPVAPSMDPLVHLNLGMARLDEGATTAAIESLRRAAFLDDSSALVQFSLGRAYSQLGDPARSRSAFFRARRLLAGQADDQRLAGGEGDTGELRHAVEVQLGALNKARP